MATSANILHKLYSAPFVTYSTTASETLYCTKNCEVFEVTTEGAEARTLAQPTKAGLECAVVLDVYVGALTLTVTGGWNQAADTTMTLGTAGDWVKFISVKVGTSYYWRVVRGEGIAEVSTEDVDVHALTALGAVPATDDLVPISDESATSDPTKTVTVAQLFQTYFNDMTPGTGISGGTGTICEHSVAKVGGLIKTTILVDLTGLSSNTAADIIGKAATANCHIGQITAAVNGAIFAGSVTCLETPTTGEPDIDLYSSTVATGTEDVAITDAALATEAALLDAAADWTVGTIKALSAYPAANTYLYLVGSGGGTDGVYDAGILLIELWGK